MFDTAFTKSREYVEKKKKLLNPWEGSPFKFITELTLDGRGSWGECFLAELLNECGADVYWDDGCNTNQKDGTYDLFVEGQRVEVKTAYRGQKNNWQHEGILSDPEYDILAFVDVDFDCVHISFLSQEHIASYAPTGDQDPILKKKYTNRRKEESKFKFDFSLRTLKLAQDAGISCDYVPSTANTDLLHLLETQFDLV